MEGAGLPFSPVAVVPPTPQAPSAFSGLLSRNISFVNHYEFRWKHRTFHKAIALGDVDNDGNVELVAGSLGGMLLVWKGTNPQPWRTSENLGTIACIAVGDVYNHGKNVLVVTTFEGLCHIFDFGTENTEAEAQCSTEGKEGRPGAMIPSGTCRIPPNINAILITDADNDGYNELLMGGSDRILYSYQLTLPDKTSAPPSPSLGPSTASSSMLPIQSPGRGREPSISREASLPLGSAAMLSSNSYSAPSLLPGYSPTKRPTPIVQTKATWSFPHHICSLCLSNFKRDVGDSVRMVLVGLQGGAYAVIDNEGIPTEVLQPYARPSRSRKDPRSRKSGYSRYDDTSAMDDKRDDQPHGRDSTPTTEASFAPTEIVSPIVRTKGAIAAVATLDGHMQLVELTGAGGGGKGIGWSVLCEVNPSSPASGGGGGAPGIVAKELFPTESAGAMHSVSQTMDCSQCFTACSLDITGSGEEVAVLCSWSGLTHFIDAKGQTISFHSHQPVRAFTAGMYSIEPGKKSPCLIYITIEGAIRIYYGIKLHSMGVSTAVAALAEDLREFDLVKQSFTNSEWDLRQEQVALIHSALYHFPQEDVERYKLYLQQRIAALKQH
ncbi:FGGAP repeat domain containing protein [Acanthamoeba castellanii str. Neff]|uniref:FGGAP repeat domain containing protein n=1 Tax=Acanthamoeba castellanii (strain ATCC 30010 / Neff) TaxID=1257118 RepID=L8GFE6_ACACF|nr:FGGAP repeat domain containing protein [Acanthamoeba castellanii str. Neff]ELR11707.1 FGGAP repeat domain containing protein [Acanthamoeba castellanii str. Neff]